ncbi:MAG: type VI secretion system tube protein Hcp [Anaerolineae bacterium]|nr:type VI secretion system tube protein Hcp [Anaerolineae bacterium]
MAGTTIYVTIETANGPIKGGSTRKTNPNAILCSYYSYEADVELHTSGGGGGASVGKAHRTPVTIHKVLDNSSPRLMKALLNGEALKTVTIELHNGTKTFFTVTLEHATITSIQLSVPEAHETPDAVEELEFIFQKISFKSANGTTVTDDTVTNKTT